MFLNAWVRRCQQVRYDVNSKNVKKKTWWQNSSNIKEQSYIRKKMNPIYRNIQSIKDINSGPQILLLYCTSNESEMICDNQDKNLNSIPKRK